MLDNEINLVKRNKLKKDLIKTSVFGLSLLGVSSFVGANSIFYRNTNGDLFDLNNSDDSNFVKLTGNQTIAGIKTFSDNSIFTGDLSVNGNITGANLSGTNTGDQNLSGLVPYTGANGNVDLGENEVFSKNINRLEVLPKKIKRIVLKNASPVVLQPDDEYTYVFGLEAEYSEVVISGWDWISERRNVVDKPSISLGRAVFKGNCLYIKNNKTIRIFEKQQNVELIDDTFISIPWGGEVEDGVPALGHGRNVNDVLLLNADFNFIPIKKLIIKDVFLDGTDLKIVVKNVDSTDIVLENFISLEEINFSHPVLFFKVAEQDGLFLINGSLNSQHTYSTDGGDNWRIKQFGINARIVATSVKTSGNNYLLGFIDYFNPAKSYIYNFNSDSFEEKSSNLFSGGTYKISRDYSGAGGTARNNYGCEPMSWKGGIGLLAVDKSFKPTLLKTTDDWDSVSEVGEYDALIPDVIAFQSSGSNNSAIHPHVFVVDDDTWFWASQYYGDSNIRNFIGKTVDGGDNWTNILQHAEFTNAYSFRLNVNNNIVCVICVTKDSVNYDDGDLIFNISLDGGNSWKFNTGEWVVVVPDGEMTTAYKSATVTTRAMIKNALIFYAQDLDQIIIAYRSTSSSPIYKLSRDGGETWTEAQGLPFVPSFWLSAAGSNAHEVSANGYIAGFASYGEVATRLFAVEEFADFDVWSFNDE